MQRTARRKEKKGKRRRGGGGRENGREAGKGRREAGEERKVVTMRSRLRYGIVGDSGHRVPFLSVTREMSIRFFGYFAGKQTANERTNERTAEKAEFSNARDISWGLPMPRIVRQATRSKYLCRSSFPFAFSPVPRPPMHLLTPRTSPRISHITFRVSLSLSLSPSPSQPSLPERACST